MNAMVRRQNRPGKTEIIAMMYPELPPFAMTYRAINRNKWDVVLFNSDRAFRNLRQQGHLIDLANSEIRVGR